MTTRRNSPNLAQIAYLDESGRYRSSGSVFQTKGEAVKEARSIAKSGEAVEVTWRDKNGKYHDQKFMPKRTRANSKTLGRRGTPYLGANRKIAKARKSGNVHKEMSHKRRRSARLERGNPVPQSQDRYESFHGHPSKELIEVKEKIHYHSALSALGDLKKLVIKPEKGPRVVIKNFKGAFLAQNEAATQLYIVGGDQAVDLADFGIRKPIHEKEVLGTCLRVYYFTTKDHLRPEDGGTAVYNHAFGRKKPTIVYDTVNHLLEFAGGGYTIPDEGIDG